MRYFSTRGGDTELSFEETVLTGLAPDGGLYIPAHIPALPQDWESTWAAYSFVDLAVAVLSLYISPDEISPADLRALVVKSYAGFRHPDITPLKRLEDGVYILELFHGPTFAFKDVALQFLGNLFEFFLTRRNARKAPGETPEKLTVVGATSGDTGSAAIYGLRSKPFISIFILFPKGRVSPIQEAQMTTVPDANVHNLAVRGTFDDCQDTVKALFSDAAFNATHRLGAVNSINWARILAQTVYYFHAHFQLRALLGPAGAQRVEFVVPTGNFGDVLAGYFARRMGLPIARLVVATNANDILARFWASGRYEKVAQHDTNINAADPIVPVEGASDGRQAGGVRATRSPAMDILVSSNFERLLWYLAHEDAGGVNGAETAGDGQAALARTRRQAACTVVDGWMGSVKQDGRVEVPVSVLEAARRDFCAERVDDELTLKTIREHYAAEPSYIADPHTAVGLAAAKIVRANNPPSTVQVVLSTAHPAKFSEAVAAALSDAPEFDFARDVLPAEFRGLLQKERRVEEVGNALEEVKAVIERYAAAGGEKGGGEGGASV